ncbi:MAG: leucine-rich repeat protein [Oscillospiraceae bacterium]|nr:leucine-rich repeat protein [Oscillospiraceae bacterium]
MKKLFAFLCSLALLCASVPVLPVTETAVITANAYEEGTYENLKYYKYEEYIEITGVTVEEDTITKLTIPAEIDGLPVTSIGRWAFMDCSSLTSVTIPNSVTSIGWGAFDGCSNLTSVTIPDSVTNIDVNAFKGTPWFEAKQAENSIVIVNNILIDGKTSTGDIIIPDGVTCINEEAFADCSNLTSVIIPDSVTSIKIRAFQNCSSLTSIIIPDSVTSIEIGTFEGCSGLTSVTIPDGVTSIDNTAFEGCSSLTSVTIPDGVTSINEAAFKGCSSLTSVTIPNGVTIINTGAFRNCSGLTSVIIPDSVTSINGGAFADCSALTDITIENPDCEIEYSAIYNSKEDDIYYFNGTIHGYENSTAQAYAENNGYPFHTLSAIPETTENPAGDTTWNGKNPDLNNDGKIDAKDAALVLVFAAEFGAGNVKSFQEFMDKQYPNG